MYRAGWYLESGAVATGLDLGEVKPGSAASVVRLLKNTGDQPFSGVQFTLKDDVPGVQVNVGGQPLTPGQTYTAPGLAPGESLRVEYSRAVPAEAEPGTWSAFISIRALV
ncbi:hypothetical protein [Deinococcus wulumuqiensis]|uniref:Uncharacterized protein n=1 Tax=Deinococcus wulumuqiensis TaxID=980427 RepID=A0AAV4K1D4_9DEIO|nr:hypothetical protein [Deinococcus wulumuqiensis]GGI75428.1 hypothetical protein GCM10010914_07060 [Deinococcus wulumuqiensis]GGP28722.1 hypothetical protein GCM10008021_03730 [Deinococcus wulumuqiensis]